MTEQLITRDRHQLCKIVSKI